VNRRRLLGTMALAAGAAQLAACADVPRRPADTDPPAPEALTALLREPAAGAMLVLGEVHDHARLHQARLAWLQAWAASGLRFAIAFEQMDAPRQPALEAALRDPGITPKALAQAGGLDFAGWDWPRYEPVFALALRHRLPLVAANLPAAEVAAVARGRAAAPVPRPAGWSEADEAAQRREIDEGHCGVLPAPALAPMALAQRARDAAMAQAMRAAQASHGLPVVLLTGNGHARRDLGVPRHLAGTLPPARVRCVGFLEAAGERQPRLVAEADARFDWQVLAQAQPRPDPCEALRGRFRAPAARG
jgi:uncharacterized iron-regulated protein